MISFKRLFEPWPALVVEEDRIGAVAPSVHPQEAAQVANAVPVRRVEFATGRSCARRALARLPGLPKVADDFALLNGGDRVPRWPSGVVGAITHTGRAPQGYCGVAVGRDADWRAIGLDAEEAVPLEPTLWPSVLTPSEVMWVRQFDGPRAGAWAKLIFSAKESFYKAQFPLSRRPLEFRDIEITFQPATATFQARLADRAPRDLPLSGCVGRYLQDDMLMLTGVAVERAVDPRVDDQ